MLYQHFKDACARRNTTLTAALKAINRSTSVTGKWKHGSYPSLDIVMELADYLRMSIDELVYGESTSTTDDFGEWRHIISHIPVEKRLILKDMLRTHMEMPEKEDAKKA